MKAAPFRLHRPESIDDAVAVLRSWGEDAKPIAGGQSLVPLLALRLARVAHLVDLNRVRGLDEVRAADGVVSIGALVRQADAEHHPDVAAHVPLLARALPLIGHFQIRNRGTIGGSLAHADPASELPAVALASDASVVIAGPHGTRRVGAGDFFVDRWATALDADELLVSVDLPIRTGRNGCAVEEVARRHGDFAMAGVACTVGVDDAGIVDHARVALFGVASTPVRSAPVEQALVGRRPGDLGPADWREIGRLVGAGLEPPDDVHATGAYRRDVAAVLTARALQRAGQEATDAR